jgi:hypothetical protein
LVDLNAKGRDLTGAIFTNTNILKCDFTCTILADIHAPRAHFHKTDLTGVSFKNAYLLDAMFTQAIFKKTDLWNVTGDGVHIISLQLGGFNVCYTSDILQVNCMQFDIQKIWWMTEEEVFEWVNGHEEQEMDIMTKWWAKWKYQIYQIVNLNPAKPVNSPK